jgi:hypothetical protein
MKRASGGDGDRVGGTGRSLAVGAAHESTSVATTGLRLTANVTSRPMGTIIVVESR